MPSNYGIKTIGIVYKRESGRKSAMEGYVHYTVKGVTYDVSGQVNSYENYKNKQVEIGDTFCVLYYPTNPEWSKVDFFMEIPDSLKAKKTSIVNDSNTLFLDLEVQDEKNERLLNDFETSITSKSINQTFSQDSTGHILIQFPNKEDIYNVKVNSKGYISKSIEVSSIGLNKFRGKDYTIAALLYMIKPKTGLDYSLLNKPVYKAYFIKDTIIDWDDVYGTKMNEEISKKIPNAYNLLTK